jgi:hypothetical protein
MATEKREEILSLRAVAPRIKTVSAETKAALPWLKLARFGDIRTKKGSLRNNANMQAISGLEGDYDSEQITVDEAVAILAAANIAGMIYTSPSHTDDTPRWRVLVPLSQDHMPEARADLLARLNGLFHGSLAGESFTDSQSYYYGSVKSSPSHRVELVDGDYLDTRPDLEAGAIGKPKPVQPEAPAPTGPRREDGSRFVEAVIRNALNKMRTAADGQKHATLRSQALLLGGYMHAGSYSPGQAVGWLMDALPGSVKDRKAAAITALWGVEQGAGRPIPIPARDHPSYAAPRTDPDPETVQKRAYGVRIFQEAAAAVAGTPGDAYLARYGVSMADIGRHPRALRFHPGLRHAESGQMFPALLAAITAFDGRHMATQITYLARIGQVWRPAPVENARTVMGFYRAGAVRLSNGQSKLPLPDAPAAEPVFIGGGIETCLAVGLAVPELRNLCAVTLDNLGSIWLPDQVRMVVIGGANNHRPAAQLAFQRAIERHIDAGREVRVARSQVGNDFPDCLQGAA